MLDLIFIKFVLDSSSPVGRQLSQIIIKKSVPMDPSGIPRIVRAKNPTVQSPSQPIFIQKPNEITNPEMQLPQTLLSSDGDNPSTPSPGQKLILQKDSNMSQILLQKSQPKILIQKPSGQTPRPIQKASTPGTQPQVIVPMSQAQPLYIQKGATSTLTSNQQILVQKSQSQSTTTGQQIFVQKSSPSQQGQILIQKSTSSQGQPILIQKTLNSSTPNSPQYVTLVKTSQGMTVAVSKLELF